MARFKQPETEAIGSDSFLDVVTNIVGILIILVLVVGIRVKQAPALLTPAAVPQPPEISLDELNRQSLALEQDAVALEAQMKEVAGLASAQREERDTLAYLLTEDKVKLDERRGGLDQQSQATFDLRRSLAHARRQLEQVNDGLRDASDRTAHSVVQIKSRSTPLSQTVFGKEVQFQLRNGRVAYIPIDELIDAFKEDAQRQAYKLRNQSEVTEIVGPRGGFRMKYTLQRIDVNMGGAAQAGSYARMKEYVLVPTSSQLGELAQTALEPNTEFRALIATLNPRSTTITIWLYPDCFAEFRQLREDLYKLGFAVAGRPLPHDAPIGGSPDGTKSAAQ